MEDEKMLEEKDSVQEVSAQELMMKKLERQLFFTRLIAVFTGLTCAVLVIVSCIVVPPVIKTLKGAQTVMNTATTTMTAATSAIETAEKPLESVEVMSDSIIETSNQLNSLVSGNASSMTKAMEELSNIDFQGLNEAISDLQAAVGPFANLMRKFQ